MEVAVRGDIEGVVELETNATVGDLKGEIATLAQCPLVQTAFAGEPLDEDGQFIADTGITAETVVDVRLGLNESERKTGIALLDRLSYRLSPEALLEKLSKKLGGREVAADRIITMHAVDIGLRLSSVYPSLQQDREIIRHAITVDPSNIQDVSPAMLEERDFALELVRANGKVLCYLPQHSRDKDIVLAAAASANVWEHIDPSLKADRDVALAAAVLTPLSEIGAPWIDDREVVSTAATVRSRDLLASPKLRGDREFMLDLVSRAHNTFKYSLHKDDRAFQLDAVRLNGRVLRFIKDADREVVLAAVRSNGRSLQYASSELKSDREVVLAAVETDGSALFHSDLSDREIVLTAIRNGYPLLPREYEQDDEVVDAFARNELQAGE